ncbi:hypothetical protein VTN02DRAFT_850 [Thermoascus thermophilus]
MDGHTGRGKAARLAAACTECQRRKQKCSREWPCNHCQARRISHLCRFAPKKASRTASGAVHRSRALRSRQENPRESESDDLPGNDTPTVAGSEDLRVLGYLPDSQNLQVGSASIEGSDINLSEPQSGLSPEMESALRTLPPKPYTDILVQHFLSDTNYHYYCLYPPTFSDEYSRWWANRASCRSLTPEFTCLLLRVCACST